MNSSMHVVQKENMKKLLLILLFGSSFLFSKSDVEIFGLRIYGVDDEYRPPVILKSEFVTIEFDVTSSLPPNLQMILKHASKDWVIDENQFVNDPMNIRTDYLYYTTAPNGVHNYTYHYKNSFPNSRNRIAFEYSGNYIYRIIDRDANDEIVGEGKFIVADDFVPTSMTIANKFLPGEVAPYNQTNYITVNVSAPAEYDVNNPKSVYHPDITTVDIIQNWKIAMPYRIDVNDKNPDTFVENFMMPEKQFWIRSVPTGNEYRRLDLSNVTMYPNNQLAVISGGPDLSRFQWPGKPDANGASKLKPFVGANSDYIEVELSLRLAAAPSKKIFITGGFTNWEVYPSYELHPDTATGLYVIRYWVRRGVYDYQYVLGDVQDGEVINQDWIALEGNDWRTTNRYIALVYYKDQRFGGFDRIVGMIEGRSPGKNEGDSLSFQSVVSKQGVTNTTQLPRK
jgi:hypothetical protein